MAQQCASEGEVPVPVPGRLQAADDGERGACVISCRLCPAAWPGRAALARRRARRHSVQGPNAAALGAPGRPQRLRRSAAGHASPRMKVDHAQRAALRSHHGPPAGAVLGKSTPRGERQPAHLGRPLASCPARAQSLAASTRHSGAAWWRLRATPSRKYRHAGGAALTAGRHAQRSTVPPGAGSPRTPRRTAGSPRDPASVPPTRAPSRHRLTLAALPPMPPGAPPRRLHERAAAHGWPPRAPADQGRRLQPGATAGRGGARGPGC